MSEQLISKKTSNATGVLVRTSALKFAYMVIQIYVQEPNVSNQVKLKN